MDRELYSEDAQKKVLTKLANRLCEFTNLTRPDVYKNAAGQLHREDGPAVFTTATDGSVLNYWCKNGILHRDGGPAVYGETMYIDEHVKNYTAIWMQAGRFHRVDGYALEFNTTISGYGKQRKITSGYYFIDGVNLTRVGYYNQLYKRGLISDLECFMELL